MPDWFAHQVKAKKCPSVYCRRLCFPFASEGPWPRLTTSVGPEDKRKMRLVYKDKGPLSFLTLTVWVC